MGTRIPEAIVDAAHRDGFNSIEYIGLKNGLRTYSVGLLGDDGLYVPTGLPSLYQIDVDGSVKRINGDSALRLLL